jgi:hypothetical protein
VIVESTEAVMRVADFVAFVYGPDRGPSPCRHHYFPKRVLKLAGDSTVIVSLEYPRGYQGQVRK